MDVPPPTMFTDPALIDKIVGELKSQGTFDQFRKECIADVDTKPAYQNLHQRVESTVTSFLDGRTWRADLNRGQLRESLRKHIHEMGFLETGVERIVDQVVNPKVNSIFMPQVEDVVYRVQGIPKPEKKSSSHSLSTVGSSSKNTGVFNSALFSQPPPFLPGLSFLPAALQSHMQKLPTLADLLPTDLDPVSPESSKESEESVEAGRNTTIVEQGGIIQHHDDSMESEVSGISDLTSHGSNNAASIKSDKENSAELCEMNEDSQLSKVSSHSKLSNESKSNKSPKVEQESLQDEENADVSLPERSSFASNTLIQYGDQFSVEEEVATSENNPNLEACETKSTIDESVIKLMDNKQIISEFNEDLDNRDSTKSVDILNVVDNTNLKLESCKGFASHIGDEDSLAATEDSQFSGSSDNKLHIDEMKEFNSQSDNSHHLDDQSCVKTSSEDFVNEERPAVKSLMDNVVEASEEARHGFDDSQDALERPPLPVLSAIPCDNTDNRAPLPPMLQTDKDSEFEEKHALPPDSPSSKTRENLSRDPNTLSESSGDFPNTATVPTTPPAREASELRLELSTTPPTKHGLTPLAESDGSLQIPPLPSSADIDEPRFSPSTPPRREEQDFPMCPSPPPTPPIAEELGLLGRPPLPTTPPLIENLEAMTRPPLPPTPPLPPMFQASASVSPPPPPLPPPLPPPPPPEEDSSRDSYVPAFDDRAIPKTPQWEPRSPVIDDRRPTFASFEFFGISDPSKIAKSFIPSPKNVVNITEEESQSGSEEMQLAWSPISAHGDEGNEESRGKFPNSSMDQHLNLPEKSKDSPHEEKDREMEHHQSEDKMRGFKGDEKRKSSDSDRHRYHDHRKDEKGKDSRRDGTHRSSSSSRRHDERSSRHKDSRDRRDSSSKSRHDVKNRSEKERDRPPSSSHHKSDEKRRDERRDDKERSLSSKHKSSHSEDRHRPKDRDRKSSTSGSSSTRHEDKKYEKNVKGDERSRSTSKSHHHERSDSDRRDKDLKDKEKKSNRDRERSRKDSSRYDEKKRDKEREKAKIEKGTHICRPNSERRSPDPDSNNGSMLGGNNQTSSLTGQNSQYQDNFNQDRNKTTGSTKSHSKSSEHTQNTTAYSEFSSPSVISANPSCPSSSLPFKKRPLLSESDSKTETSTGQIILRIKKLRTSLTTVDTARRRRMRAMRRLERQSIRNLDKHLNFPLKVFTETDLPSLSSNSSTKYFESDWPSKSDDKAFLRFVHNLEGSSTLSALSDFSQSESEEEEVFAVDDLKTKSDLEDMNMMLSLSVLTNEQAGQLPENRYVISEKEKEKASKELKGKTKARARQKKNIEGEKGVKRRRVTVKEFSSLAPTEPKSRRERKPNKRYSNDEFTSHFDYEEEDEFESADEGDEEANIIQFSANDVSELASTKRIDIGLMEMSSSCIDKQEKEKENKADSRVSPPEIDNQSEKSRLELNTRTTYSWNRDSDISSSEDEIEKTNSESDLIGTALKNLMMESGLDGPVEDSGSQRYSSSSCPIPVTPLSGLNNKTFPLSGVKRVGLSKSYKGSKKLSISSTSNFLYG